MRHNASNPDGALADFKVPAKRFLRLLDYMDTIGFDQPRLAASVGLDFSVLQTASPDQEYLAIQYSMLYQLAVEQMQELKQPIPWAAGMGSEAFKMMCYCIITCRTLGEALERAQRYDRLLFPLIGYRVELEQTDTSAHLLYRIDSEEHGDSFAPADWDRRVYYDTVAKSSGLRIWYAFIGWLTGREIKLEQVTIATNYVTDGYHKRLKALFNCPIQYDAQNNLLEFSAQILDYRVVHNSDSLEEFLHAIPYWLMATDRSCASTSSAIKSLLGKDFSRGAPSFERMAENLHMSSSSLRRRLLKEDTSYQQLKDQCRCELAIDYLCRRDMKIQDIAEQIGFTETSSFVRSFRSWTGMTPTAFREQHPLP